MIGRRVQPLFAVLALGGLVCLLRLFQVQVLEHELWAGEAARLVSFGRLEPYERGSILDTNGVVLATDKETHELVLVYREFRRGHPLGQVAHARSLLEGRAVPLQEAHGFLLPWVRELVELSPASLERFADGGALDTPTLHVAPLAEGEQEGRARRAGDVRFYVRRLLDLTPREWSDALGDAGGERSFLALAAERRGVTPEVVWSELEQRLIRTEEQLVRLAGMLRFEGGEGDAPGAATPLERLVEELEASRRWVEDAAASKLFAESAGFSAGRVAPHTLRAFVDLDWIRRLFAWDDERLHEWTETSRSAWVSSWRDGYALPHLVAALRLDPTLEVGPDEVLDHISALFLPGEGLERALDGELPDWRAVDDLAVFHDLDGLLVADVPEDVGAIEARAAPFLLPELRAIVPRPEVRWNLVDAVLDRPPDEPSWGRRFAADLRSQGAEPVHALHTIARAIADDWERAFQASLVEAFLAVRRSAGPDDVTPAGRLRVARDRRERAAERSEYFLKDYGLRPRSLAPGEPDYEVIYLITRYEEYYPGFQVREARERVYPVVDEEPARLAGKLLGHVSSISAFDMQSQRAEIRRLRELRDTRRRTHAEELELVRLVGRVLQHDEVKGVFGLEGFLDPELVGRNGYFETRGLDDLSSDRRSFATEAVDGKDVWLTLDARIQGAAERTLRHPVPVDDPLFDHEWNLAPVGSIVLVTPGGDVLAAASEPGEGSDVPEGTPGQRGLVIDRAFRIPDFQPPGSVFKPFVAAYALDRAGLDPSRTVVCGPIERGGAGYVDVRCHSLYGHGPVNLEQAIRRSCNAYFAWLGESLSTDDFRALAPIFGFGEETGVKDVPLRDDELHPRVGFRDEAVALFRHDLTDLERRLAGNGLAVVEATPVQLARAFCGLATGVLPSMRLVREVGGEELSPGPSRPVPLSRGALEFVREAMAGVANASDGTAHGALSVADLGFPVAVKTGSADIVRRDDSADRRKNRVRKHTWVAGWVPEQDPVAVFVIFMHDTTSTSSHGAVYLARQFLHQPEVLAWLARHGVGELAREGGR